MSGKQFVFIDGEQQTTNLEVILVGKNWLEIKPPVCKSFKGFIDKIGNFPNPTPDVQITIAFPFDNRPAAGLSRNVHQIHSLGDFMRGFYGVDDQLPESTLNWIFDKVKSKNGTAITILQESFFPDGVATLTRSVFSHFNRTNNNDNKNVLLWILCKSIPEDSYLYHVLTLPQISIDNFHKLYVVDAAVANLKNKKFAKERQTALKELDKNQANSLIIQFIEQVKNNPLNEILSWLNNDTKIEHGELLRRVSSCQYPVVPNEITENYPALKAYLADYDFGNTDLTDYFNKYRKLKIFNHVTKEFCQSAFDIKFNNISSRNEQLIPFAKDPKNALLVVDAIGVEYLPFIVTQSKENGLNIERHNIASVNLPTSTKFNKIEINGTILPEIKTLDNIVHNGAKKNEQTEYYENIVEVLDEILPQVFRVIAQNIDKYDRIILTADHGASRLAVLANDLELIKTLDNPFADKPDDWRYIKRPEGKRCPDEFIETLDGNYCVVRGYNRLPKQGGKQYEVHGGYTPEETLVPFIIFSKHTIPDNQATAQTPIKQQIKEKDDFDI
ncbi:MAG: BREX-4 system phosphatase PglZ [Planctomycetaceae bacterium]|nr:BREX-4 system phosphatase PglZ [Planctomycetaceae bacterium]